jgi:hypothetical protein
MMRTPRPVAFQLTPMTNKLRSCIVLAAAALICVGSLAAQAEKKAEKKGKAAPLPLLAPARLSPHETTYVRIGSERPGSLVSLTYGRPYAAKGGKGEPRKIWGELVKWEKADRLGADEATTIILEDPIEIGGKTIPAGAHVLYIIPSASSSSKLAFSSHIGKWGIPVDEKNDIARVDLKKDTIDENVDQLTIVLENHQSSGLIKIKWEKTQFSVPFTVKK